jgi:formate hydrogenlyase subunit 3/multisubunit Na+/H+ antiporter MnhD subunit
MISQASASVISVEEHGAVIAERDALRRETQILNERLAVLEHQVEWFKRQLFGRKSERRLIEILFLIAGIVWRVAGHYDLRRIGGLYEARPGLALLFLLAAFALVGLPPLSGFWGKLLLLREGLAQGQHAWVAVVLGVSLLTLYSMAKIWLEAFWKPHPTHADLGARVPGLAPAYAAATVLVGLGLVLGLAPETFVRYSEAAVAAFAHSAGGAP